ncbi:hypothetical protein KEM54_006450 [Ascosphaera aggregata]|nr:hypothetical protein KEM54_006450 [Ascosphaera aggregata]
MAPVPRDVERGQAASHHDHIMVNRKHGEQGTGEVLDANVETVLGSTRKHQSLSTSFGDERDSSSDNPCNISETKRWYRKLNPLRWRKVPPLPNQRQASREERAGFLSAITFHWISPLMTTGYLRNLEHQDIWLVKSDRQLELLSDRLQTNFLKLHEQGSRHPLLWALYRTLKKDFFIGACCQLVAALLQVFTPYTTRYLISFATEAWVSKQLRTPEPHIGRGVGLVIGICLMQLTQSLTMNQFFYRGMIAGGQARAALIDAIFIKSTKISSRALAGGKALPEETVERSNEENGNDAGQLKEARDRLQRRRGNKDPKLPQDVAAGIYGDGTGYSNGRIITLMSIDADRIDRGFGLFHMAWTSPLIILVTLIMLLVNIGYSCLAGYGLLFICVPLLTYAVKSLFRRRMLINKVTDQRVSLTQEILHAIRFVKYFSWESSFLQRLKHIRAEEIRKVQVVQSIRNALMCMAMALPPFASMLSFITYALSKHDMNPAFIFSSLAMFNSLRAPLNILPLTITQLTDAFAALTRIQAFLLAEEQEEAILHDSSLGDIMEVSDATFTWERTPTDEETKGNQKTDGSRNERSSAKSTVQKSGGGVVSLELEPPPFKIEHLNLCLKRNELVAVIGSVGCGKTSLLSALAGEMRLVSGSAHMNASRAYCPQYAWIQNATVRDNILFGKPFVREKYDRVIEACALKPDLEMFTAGDRTEIGERGITLSGGQKQRLNIARAIYFGADLVLLDDPLSAVDAHVGRHIMDNAICGLLKNSCRLLATHQLHVLSRCDRIILMDRGNIERIGTFSELLEDSDTFRRLMSSTSQETSGQEESKTNNIEKDSGNDDNEPASKDDGEKSQRVGATTSLMQEEDRGTGTVSWRIWVAYISAFGRFAFLVNLPVILVSLIASNGANIITGLWLSWWTSDKFGLRQGVYMGSYAGLGCAQVLIAFAYATAISLSATNASRKMFSCAMTRIFRAPMSFFDTTPLGRITNRFSKDIHVMDNELTDTMRIASLTVAMILSIVILVIVIFHWFALALVPLMIMFTFAAAFYRTSALELKRHESVLRSNVFAQFAETLTGIPSIKAYGMQESFRRQLRKALDDMDSAYFLTFANQRWLSVRIDAVGNLMVFVVGILVVTSRFNVSPSTSGLVLSYILSIVSMLQFAVREVAEMENNMNATERVHAYATTIQEEAPLHTINVDSKWPQTGKIQFYNVQMRYRPELPLVLKGLTMDIAGGEKIGFVGRTGAGKSSIMQALSRLSELSGGRIIIDDIDISKIGLHDLRSRLAIIPQDPALFRGTIRTNLDPFEEHTDLELWQALRKAGLVDEQRTQSALQEDTPQPTGSLQRLHLDSPVEEDGLNYSLGQRQLIALARALVRDSRIIICDEATSSVDFETDRRIQRTMAQGFKGKTLLCIAHRLRTIIHYDRICVVDQGEIAEMDRPLALWSQESSIFRGMCDRSGITRDDFDANDEDTA